MDVFLFGLDLDGDNDDYAILLAKAGFKSPDDLYRKEPAAKELVTIGIEAPDAAKIAAAISSSDGPIKRTLSTHIARSTMDVFLFGLDLDGDIDDYTACLANAGYNTPAVLVRKDPTAKDLVALGIEPADAEKIYGAIQSENGGDSKDLAVDEIIGSSLSAFGIEGLSTPSASIDIDLGPHPTFGGNEGHHLSADDLLDQFGLGADSAPLSVFNAEAFGVAKVTIEIGNFAAFQRAIENLDVNMHDPVDGNTLLHWTVANKRKPMAELLIAKSARHEENIMGKTPLELAIEASKGDSSFVPIREYLVVEFAKALQAGGVKR